ncbi:unnamed protein product, partial [Ectocarpus fasciculatus]
MCCRPGSTRHLCVAPQEEGTNVVLASRAVQAQELRPRVLLPKLLLPRWLLPCRRLMLVRAAHDNLRTPRADSRPNCCAHVRARARYNRSPDEAVSLMTPWTWKKPGVCLASGQGCLAPAAPGILVQGSRSV